MSTLHLSQFAEKDDTFRVELSLDGGSPVRTRFTFALSPQDQEDLRWYLEDYLQYPLDPAPKIAARVEERMRSIGTQLFKNVFESGEPARRLWARLQPTLSETRIQISTEIQQATAIPWELLRDPLTDEPLALCARAFVRVQSDQVQPPPPLPAREGNRIRILLVICRPRGREDVPFRSVASRILKSLSDDARDLVQLDVLRPPTFEQLAKTLREARQRGQPYHVVHFDGHGTYVELVKPDKLGEVLKTLSIVTLGTPRAGKHGYLLFENPQVAENAQLVDGPALGKLLSETGVPVLMLNACQSAFAEAPTAPLPVGEEAGSEASTQEQGRAFGSLAQEVMNAGVAGVVAMRYVLYVETAKRLVSDLYAALLQGSTLGEAVTFGRKQLASNPYREIAFNPIALQDWPVPIVYEATPIALFPKPGRPQGPPLRITLDTAQRAVIQGVPPPPDVGFYGRDETLLALDRAFDTQRVVLLHAYAGSGKTATAAEFARWYVQTGGVQGAVLFTSFEQYKPLPRALDAIEQVFGPALEQAGVHWLALSDADRCAVALQVLRQIPVLWIWDNVEPITGFPSSKPGEGSEPSPGSVWSAAEQKELVDFLRTAGETKAKFLLTSRRDEHGWLGDLPRRLTLPPMPMQERVQLARALAEKYGHRLAEVEDWRPLLRFTQGNPLAITVLVGQALRDGLKRREQIEAFVDKLRKGEAAFADEASEGRSKSLGASLSYGFASAFSEAERKQLALLHFFQGFVDVDALRYMGHPELGDLPEVRGLTREEGIRLLDRAAEIGLLTVHGGGYYSIHPALPWYFKSLFDQYYGQTPIPTPSPDTGEGSGVSPSLAGKGPGVRSATRAFVEAMGALGNYYHNQYGDGNRDVIGVLGAEEANLLQARRLARCNGWWLALMKTMQGLDTFYDHTGRRVEWQRLVEEIVPDFVDPATDGPRPGCEEEWGLVTEYRVRLAREARQWAAAERLQRVCVDWDRHRAALALAVPPAALDDVQKNTIRTLAASLEQLGHILREQGQPECVAAYQEAVPLYQHIGDRPAEANAAFNLGHAYKNIPALRDLAQAERWYRRSLELRAEGDRLGRGKCHNQLGAVAYECFNEARAAKQPKAELERYLNAAAAFHRQALDLTPPDAVDDLAVTHNQLGLIYADAGDLDRALHHYREAVRYTEAAGNLYQAAKIRFNVAVALAQSDRLVDAMDYARAALRGFQTLGDSATADGVLEFMKNLQGLIRRGVER